MKFTLLASGLESRDVEKKILMMVDLIINIASETLRLLYVIVFVTGLAIILLKKPVVFLKTTFIT